MLSAIVGSIAISVSTLGQVEPETIPFVIEMVQISGLESCAVTVTTEGDCKISAARRKVWLCVVHSRNAMHYALPNAPNSTTIR